MWDPGAPAADDPLRQGDLLDGLPIVGRQSGEPDDGQLTLRAEAKTYIVMSHCCTIENHGVVALARVQTLRVPDPPTLFVESLRVRLPVDPAAGVNVPTNYFLLDPYPQQVPDGRVKVANFLETRIVDQGSDHSWLTKHRVARMTVLGRRDLRSRLALFWARATEEDEQVLAASGQPLLVAPYTEAAAEEQA